MPQNEGLNQNRDELSDREPNSSLEHPLTDVEREQSEQLLDTLEEISDPVLKSLFTIDSLKETFIAGISTFPAKYLEDKNYIHDYNAKSGNIVKNYLETVANLPKTLKDSGVSDAESVSILTAQYVSLDENLVDCLTKTTDRHGIFKTNSPSEVAENFNELYEAEDTDIEEIGQCVASFFLNSIENDIGVFNVWLNELLNKQNALQARAAAEKFSNDMNEIRDLLKKNIEKAEELQEIFEHESDKNQTTARKIGNHALETTKIIAGSALGFLIAKKLNSQFRKSN